MQRDGRVPAPPASKNIQAYPASSLSKNTQAHTPSSSPSLRHQPRLHNPPPSPAAAPLHPFPLHAPSLLHSTHPPCNPRLQAREHTHTQSECVHTKSKPSPPLVSSMLPTNRTDTGRFPRDSSKKSSNPGVLNPSYSRTALSILRCRCLMSPGVSEWVRGW